MKRFTQTLVRLAGEVAKLAGAQPDVSIAQRIAGAYCAGVEEGMKLAQRLDREDLRKSIRELDVHYTEQTGELHDAMSEARIALLREATR